MEHNGIFRKSLFGGFDQKAVLSYIEQLEREKAETLAKLEACLGREEQCRQNELRMSQMEAEMAEKDALVASLTAKNEQLTLQLTEKLERIQRRECELESLQEQADGLIEKSELYTNVSEKIGDTLLQAQATADRIVGSAKRDQTNIRNQTIEMIDRTMSDIDGLRQDLDVVRSRVELSLHALDSHVSSILDSIDGASRNFAGKKSFLDNRQKFEEAAEQAKQEPPISGEEPKSPEQEKLDQALEKLMAQATEQDKELEQVMEQALHGEPEGPVDEENEG